MPMRVPFLKKAIASQENIFEFSTISKNFFCNMVTKWTLQATLQNQYVKNTWIELDGLHSSNNPMINYFCEQRKMQQLLSFSFKSRLLGRTFHKRLTHLLSTVYRPETKHPTQRYNEAHLTTSPSRRKQFHWFMKVETFSNFQLQKLNFH